VLDDAALCYLLSLERLSHLFNALGVNSFPFVMFNHMFIRVRSSAIN